MSEADWGRLVKAFIRQPAHFPVYEDPRAADAVDDMDLSSEFDLRSTWDSNQNGEIFWHCQHVIRNRDPRAD